MDEAIVSFVFLIVLGVALFCGFLFLSTQAVFYGYREKDGVMTCYYAYPFGTFERQIWAAPDRACKRLVSMGA